MDTQAATTSKAITRADLVLGAARTVRSASNTVVRDMLETIIDEITQTLVQGKNVQLRGFGSFVVRAKTERIGRNPRTGEPATISPRRVLSFKPSPVLLAIMNNEEAPAATFDDYWDRGTSGPKG
ncbi:integration host factor subunit alpha [Beijerinckia sp. L45]|uniref:integration host factor subunit alpha n=1 Tax=Beijerinckia sp. L45 TaxID=1641855 RepID=UPI001FEE71AC|nr:integration host factor subunit alpha [Beijerinckia sp. L45]